MRFIGRGKNRTHPIALVESMPLTNTVGAILDPIMSLRTRIRVQPGKSSSIAYLLASGEEYEHVLQVVEKYKTKDSIIRAFRLALRRSQVENGFLNIKGKELEVYQELISSLFFIHPHKKEYEEILSKNQKGQSGLWNYGISGDLPIVLLFLNKSDEIHLLYEVLKAHEYWRMKNIKTDLVILSEEESGYTQPLFSLISDIVVNGNVQNMVNKPGGIFILDRNHMDEETLRLFHAASRMILRGDKGTLREQINSKFSKPIEIAAKISQPRTQYPFRPLEDEALLFYNGLGGFNLSGTEYILHLEKNQNTSAPWSNIIANPKFGFLVTEAGSGYTWSENSRENKLTPWSNDPVTDLPGEVIYFLDRETNEIWTPTPLPIREDSPYKIRHGFGYTIFEHYGHGVKQKLTTFVPLEDSIKISLLQVHNESEKERKIQLYYYVRPVLGVSDQFTAMHIKTSLIEKGGILVENPYNEEFKNRKVFVDSSENISYVTGDRNEFLSFGGLSEPLGVRREKLSGRLGSGFDPCAVIQVDLILAPLEKREISFLLGEGKSMEEVKSLTKQYKNLENVQNVLKEVKRSWREKLGILKIKTPDPSMNLLLNGWLTYQVISSRMWARTGFYQAGGAFGFRDQLQDAVSLALFHPQWTKEQILFHGRHQFIEGDVEHWWHEPHNKGTRTRFSDDLLWLPYGVIEYIRITGDKEILDTELPFVEGEPLKEFEDEYYSTWKESSATGSLYDHCIRAIEKSLSFGKHGLPLMGSGDWNDGMNTVGNKGQGESIWLAWFLIYILNHFSVLTSNRGEIELSHRYEKVRDQLSESVEQYGWDGNWYRRAYFDNGMPLGSIENPECKIDSIAQSWAVISGGGNAERIKLAMASLENYLIDRDEGMIKLLTPPFHNSDLEPGYIKGYVPGVRENGGQYSHASAWVIIAFAMLGDGDKAGELFELINPINHARTPMEAARYKVEPYVMSADVYAVLPHTGRGGWTWYTGSAGWMVRAGMEHILGIKKLGDKLVMDPCIPEKWNEFMVQYKFKNTLYEIKVLNPEKVSRGVKKVLVNGTLSEGNSILLEDDKKPHHIEVILG